MQEPIPFEDSSGIKMEKLKEEIDRRITKISWLVQQKLKKLDKKQTNPIQVVDIGFQTDNELFDASKHSTGFLSFKTTEASFHIRGSSVGVGINTQSYIAAKYPALGSLATEVSIDANQDRLVSPRQNPGSEEEIRDFFKQYAELKEGNISERDEIAQPPIKEQGENSSYSEHSKPPSDDDSLNGELNRKKIEEASDQKFFNQKNIQESLIASKASILSSPRSNAQSQKHIQVNEKRNKENDSSKSREKTKPKSVSRPLVKSSHVQSKAPPKKVDPPMKKEMRRKTETDPSKKASSKGSQPSEFMANFINSNSRGVRNTVNIPSIALKPENIKPVKKESIAVTERKPGVVIEKIEKPVQQKQERVIVKAETKERMRELVKTITPRARREANDGTVRSNLLKRIQEKQKINHL